MYGSPLSQIMQISDLVQMGWTRLAVSKLSKNICWQKLLRGLKIGTLGLIPFFSNTFFLV